MKTPPLGLVFLAACGFALTCVTPGFATLQSSGNFALDPTGATAAQLGYYPVPVKLLETKPAGVKIEPAYAATPKYGVFKVGDGPRSAHYLALDEPANGTWKIYVDLNGDGDLTSSGDGAWTKKTNTPGREMYGVNEYVVRASYGTAQEEKSSAGYGVAFYRFVARDDIFMFRQAVRRGAVTVDGQPHKALLAENDADGVYAKPIDDDGKPVSGGPSRPVWLLLDLNDDGKWGQPYDVRGPFKLGDKAYVADLAPDGSTISFAETTRPVAPPQMPPRPLLPAGATAPDFEAEAWGGGSLHLSDYRGKVVVLDFWSTWCGPCQRSMPHIESIYQVTKDQDVVVLGVCVWDEKEAYTKWVPEKQDTYHFKLAFDPAARDTNQSIAAHKYNVSGIPTTYVIDKDGKVAAAIVGYQDGDKRLEEALGKLGVNTQASTTASSPQEMTEELMARLIKYTRAQKDTGSVSSKLGKVLELCDGTSDLPLKLAQSDSTDGAHYFGLPPDADSRDILFIVKHEAVVEAYLTDKSGELRAAAVLENGNARLILNEKAADKFQAELSLFAGEASSQLPPSETATTAGK